MLAIARINEIRDIVRRDRSVLVGELAQRFEVAEETIRRDLKKLEDDGLVVRVYGGAYCTDSVQSDVNVTLRETIMVEEKKRIASLCLARIENGDSLFLDASTTVLQLAELLTQYAVTIITNSLKVAQCLAASKNINLLLVGGQLDHTSMSFVGSGAVAVLDQYFVDKAFVSCRSLSLEHGITDANNEQAALRRTAIRHAAQSFLMADHTKFGNPSFARIAGIEDIDHLVTDALPPEEWRAALKADRVELMA